jgi:predicted nucleic acid-binding protein
MPLVLDASCAAAGLLPDEASALADAAFDRLETDHAVVPALFWFEIRSVLLSNERRRRIEAGQIAILVRRLDGMPFEVDQTPSSEAVLGLARAHGLSVYDAAYLELAQRRGLPLATLDRRLGTAAEAVGVSLFAG